LAGQADTALEYRHGLGAHHAFFCAFGHGLSPGRC
jgi:hypothetical protein